jgi:fused signal recognition particle receptor
VSPVIWIPVVVVVLVLVGLVLWRSTRTPTRSASTPTPPTPPRVGGSAGGFRSGGLATRVRAVFSSSSNGDAWSGFEELLLRADVGPRATTDITRRIRSRVSRDEDPAEALREEIVSILGPEHEVEVRAGELDVILVVGVNGAGKTTTIGKLAALLAAQGRRVSVAAADTFRAAAGEQLEVWAQRAGAHLVAQDRGADPGAVVFDAVTSARARGIDVLLIDTAGRLHTKQPLMDELEKLHRVVAKAGGTVTETLLVLDAQTGQNGIAQARAFTEAVDLTGVVLTKTDGSAKGGVVLAVREELGLPIRYVGVGEGLNDLQPFDPDSFADRLLG